MRVLIHGIDFSPEKVGIGKYTGEMAEWLAMRGHEVRVVTTAPHFPQWKVFEGYSSRRFTREMWLPSNGARGALRVTRCPVWMPREPCGWNRILYLVSFALSSAPPMLMQISWHPDVILLIEPTLFCAPHVLFVAKLTGSSAWLHVQDFEVDAAFQLGGLSSRGLKRLAQAAERFLTSKFDRVSTISHRMVERLPAKGVDSSKSVLFPNWVDTSAIYPLLAASALRLELGIPEQAIVALYSGSMGMKHGLQLLVDASRRLAPRSDIHFVFCGDGPYREVLQEEKRENVSMLPLQPADRLNELLNLADLHLLPQLADASDLVMPSKLTGMMASGRAVVATARAGTQIASVLEGRGIVTDPGDVDAFVSAITRLAEDANLRRRMGEAARQYAVENMDRGEILSRFEMSIMEIYGRSRLGVDESLSPTGKGRLPLSQADPSLLTKRHIPAAHKDIPHAG
ncbi:MAG TPA: glycosyltransferase WbuB [Terriglobia bacterium]|nr:glycosyltransferase WbuB [Candidatus Acidoferrum sp.]HMD85299.1 glycosyltransferase WbuB [Terriglobia bacterium]